MLGRVAPSLARPVSRLRSVRPAIPRWQRPTHVPKCWEKSTAVAVKIKLKRLGKIREPYYRIVVADSRTKRDGRAIEEIGKYHPKLEPSLIQIDSERAQYWLSVGAQPTEPVQRLLTITGDWQKFKGLPGTEGTLRTSEPKADKKDRYEELVKESFAAKEAKAAAKPARSSAPKRDAAKKAEAAPVAEAAPAEAVAEAVPAETAPGEAAAEAVEAVEAKPTEAAPVEATAAEATAAEATATDSPAAESSAAGDGGSEA
jgi:small subunit ribosomal protein S16